MTWEFALEPILLATLTSVRLLMMLQTAPLFRESGVPARIRVTAAFLMAWLMAPEIPESVDWRNWGPGELVLALVVEAGIGFILGFTANLFFVGFSLMGDFVSTQGGLGAARVVDPSSGAASTALARTFNGFAVMIFLAINGHHDLLRSVALSFSELPPGSGGLGVEAFYRSARTGSVIFEIGARMAAPITVAIFVQNVATAVLSKSLQQLNLMVVQLPAHIGLCLVILGLGAGEFMHAFKDVIELVPGRVLAILLGAT